MARNFFIYHQKYLTCAPLNLCACVEEIKQKLAKLKSQRDNKLNEERESVFCFHRPVVGLSSSVSISSARAGRLKVLKASAPQSLRFRVVVFRLSGPVAWNVLVIAGAGARLLGALGRRARGSVLSACSSVRCFHWRRKVGRELGIFEEIEVVLDFHFGASLSDVFQVT